MIDGHAAARKPAIVDVALAAAAAAAAEAEAEADAQAPLSATGPAAR